jgi:hypothetical protein
MRRAGTADGHAWRLPAPRNVLASPIFRAPRAQTTLADLLPPSSLSPRIAVFVLFFFVNPAENTFSNHV